MKTFVIGLLAAASLAVALPASAATSVAKPGPASATTIAKAGPQKTLSVRKTSGKTVKVRHHRHLTAAPQAKS